MMKKQYLQPSLVIVQVKTAELICNSQDIISDLGIDYGGVDEDGTETVDSRRHQTVWDDEEEEEEVD